MRTRVLLVDDHAIVRSGIKMLLKDRYDICGEAADGQEAVEMAAELVPDLVLMDISMPKLNGLDASRRIRELQIRTKIILVSMHDSEEAKKAAAQVGADKLVLKSHGIDTLIEAIEELATSPFVLVPSLKVPSSRLG